MCNICGTDAHSVVHCPCLDGREVCMTHCSRCVYHLPDDVSVWCRYFPIAGGDPFGSSEKGRG